MTQNRVSPAPPAFQSAAAAPATTDSGVVIDVPGDIVALRDGTCDAEGCGRTFATSAELRIHKRTHGALAQSMPGLHEAADRPVEMPHMMVPSQCVHLLLNASLIVAGRCR